MGADKPTRQTLASETEESPETWANTRGLTLVLSITLTSVEMGNNCKEAQWSQRVVLALNTKWLNQATLVFIDMTLPFH
mgnify:CR=1 FL=1